MLTQEELETVGLTPEARFPKPASAISQALRAIERTGGSAAPDTHGTLVRPVRSSRELEEVYRLTHDAYVERGYCDPRPGGRLVHYPHLENIPETTVLVALQDDCVMGTVSVTLDGPRGFHVDGDFKAACDGVRAEGIRVGASWRIVTRLALRGERQTVMALIGEAARQAFEVLELDTLLCSFNPRHERIYQRLLGMRTIARSENTEGLRSAPAVLMRCDRDAVPAKWLRGPRASQELADCSSASADS